MELAYDDIGVGPAVVLLHGFPLCRKMWQSQIDPLAAAGYRVIVPDLRGFGDSPASDETSIELYADDVIALLDRLGIVQAAIGGMSMGGYVLQSLLERHRRRVAAALFIVTRSGADDAAGRERRTALAATTLAHGGEEVTGTFAGTVFSTTTERERPELLTEVAMWMRANSIQGLVAGLWALRDRRDYTELLADWWLPALVIGAEDDRAIPPAHAEALARRLPQARLCVIPGGGHMVNMEQPELFNRALLEFLAGVTWE